MTSDATGAIVIIGAGETGGRAALALRELGHEGTITLVGNEAHLPYERPPLSKDALIEAEMAAPRVIVTEDQLKDAGIQFLPASEAIGIDREAQAIALANGRVLRYDRLLLATGAAPRRLAMASGWQHCAYLRTHDDAAALRKRLVPGGRIAVIGGGFIGLEIAASARTLGCDVTIIEGQSRILMRGVPQAIAEAVHAAHLRHGARVLTGQAIAEIADQGSHADIILADGTTVAADLVVIGVGAMPNTALAEAAGLDIDNGIAVDRHLQTSDPAIYAAGDCASFPAALYDNRRIRLESWRNTQEQARIAAANMLGGSAVIETVPWFWSDQYDMSLQVAGLADAAVTTVRRDLGDGAFILFGLAEDGRLVTASGIGPGNAVAKDIRIAEMLIAKRARPEPSQLAAPATKLKALLAA